MTRPVYIIVYTSPLFPAHWSLWIPSQGDAVVGKRVHAKGDAMNGFEVEIDRNYNIERTARQHQLVPLAQVQEAFISSASCTEIGLDLQPCDKIEEVALNVPAPGPSLLSSSRHAPCQRIQIKNCQTWLRDVVEKLVEEGVMDSAALSVVDQAPKN